MYQGNYTVLLYEYRHLIGDAYAVCSVYATSYDSWYPLLLVLMLVFDGGVHNYHGFQMLFSCPLRRKIND